MQNKIYYVEDDTDIAESVACYLAQKGFQVETASTAREARVMISRALPALLLVDWNLPDENGSSLCRCVKEQYPALPLMFLTVRGDSRDIVEGLDGGADDYLVKPFDPAVLHSRICALLRRAGEPKEQGLYCGNIRLNPAAMRCFLGEEEIRLGAMEYELLRILLENKNRTVTRGMLLEHVWDVGGNFVNDNTLTVTVKRLREKLGQPSCLKTIRSFGYRMEEKNG